MRPAAGLAGAAPVSVAPGYELVAEQFARVCADPGRPGGFGLGGGAFCAYVNGTKVVDLQGGWRRVGEPWQADTRTTLMSATKGLAALCVQVLCDRGALDVEARVADYWPEFAAAGKADVRVRHLLNHTVGLVGLPNAENLLDWTGRGWDDIEAIGRELASATPVWSPGTRIGYHAVTIGWLLGELVRRRAGETIGTYFRREIATPLDLDAWIGTPIEEHGRTAELIPESADGLTAAQEALVAWYREQQRVPGSLPAQAALFMHGRSMGDEMTGFLNLSRVRRIEIPAANGTATARSLARMYALLANDGELDGVRLLSPATVERFAQPTASGNNAVTAVNGNDKARAVPMTYALGYECNVDTPDGPRLGPGAASYGHAGAGGQLGFCDPRTGIAIAYVRSHLTVEPRPWSALVDAVYACADDLHCGAVARPTYLPTDR